MAAWLLFIEFSINQESYVQKNTASRRLNPDRKFIPFRFTVG
jgi:hypothetical protein